MAVTAGGAFRTLGVLVTGRDVGLKAALMQAGRDVEAFTRQAEAAGKRQEKAFSLPAGAAKAGAIAVATALATAAVASGVAAAQLDANLRNYNSIARESEQQLAATGQAVIALSRTLPQSADEISKGLYDIASSGFQGADGLLVVAAASKAASAGLTSTAEAAKAIDAVLNAYGLSAASAADVSDTLFQTVNLGVINFEQLTSVIGDTVGAAAAAKIPIQDLGAAVAAVTLSGISPSEAGTSVNNLITSLIKPSEQLAGLYQKLGYESGEAAIASRGLYGVMEDLRKATGGNVTALLGLFPEIRSARGAFALMAADGKNYAKTMAGIADSTARAGATQKAFDEQMKSASAQASLFFNNVKADAIQLGLVLLPPFVEVLHAVDELRGAAGAGLAGAFQALTPALTALLHTGENIVDVFAALAGAVAPVVAAIGTLAGGAVVGALTVLARALEAVTGVLADHPELVAAIAAVYLATLLPSIAAVTVALNRLILTPVIMFLVGLETKAITTAAAAKALAASLLSVRTIGMVGLGVAIGGLIGGLNAWSEAQTKARDSTDRLLDGLDLLDAQASQKAVDSLRAIAEQAVATGKDVNTMQAGWELFVGGIGKTFGAPVDTPIADAAAQGQAAAKAYRELQEKLGNVKNNVRAIAQETGTSSDAVIAAAKRAGVDLSKPFKDSIEARRQVQNYMQDLAKQTGLSTQQMAAQVGDDLDAMEERAKALKKVVDSVAQAFTSSFDVLGFDPSQASEKYEAATQQVADAQQKLKDVEERVAAKRKKTVGDVQALRKAHEDLAKAQQEQARTADTAAADQGLADAGARLEAAQKRLAAVQARIGGSVQPQVKDLADLTRAADEVTRATDAQAAAAKKASQSGSLAQFYRDSTLAGKAFADNINSAIQKGLDPSIVVRLLQAGPKAAGPLVEQIAKDHSGTLVKIVNDGEAELARLNSVVIEQARITQLAISDKTGRLSLDFSKAQGIALQYIKSNGTATAEEIAKSLSLPVDEVRRIGKEIGYQFMDSAQAEIAKYNLSLGGTITVNGLTQAPRQDLKRMATGGLAVGPGTSTSDSIPALLSRGEYVLPARAVAYYGTDLLERMRRLGAPRFAAGGLVDPGMRRAVGAASPADPRVITVLVPVTETHTENAPIYVDKVITGSPESFAGRDRPRRFSPTRGVS